MSQGNHEPGRFSRRAGVDPILSGARKRGLIRSMGRVMFYPLVRTAESFGESRDRIAAEVARLRAARAAAHTAVMERVENGSDPDSAPQRFEALVALHGWTDQGLAEQLKAVKRTKLFAMISTGLALVGAITAMVLAPVWALLLISVGTMGVATMGLAQTFRFGLYQAQLESRALINYRQYLCRPDFFSHLVG